MTARSTPTSSHRQSRPKSSAKPQTQGQSGATKDSEKRAHSAKEDQERSDWEGMTPKPEQQDDDVAAPGHVPEVKH